MHQASLLAVLLYVPLPTPVCAQYALVPLPADVETVVSGGYWEVGDTARGRFRAVITTNGLEHLISGLRIEWIRDPEESNQAPRPLFAMDVTSMPAGISHLVNPSFALDGSTWVLSVDAVNTHCAPPTH